MTNVLVAARTAISARMYADETTLAGELLKQLSWREADRASALTEARTITASARGRRAERHVLEVFLQEFGLSTDEGIALMGLAEALLRIPDERTADNLIAERIHAGQWQQYRASGGSSLVKAAAGGLLLSRHLVDLDAALSAEQSSVVRSLLNRMSRPVVRAAVRQAMRLMGGEFVLGRTIEEALQRTSDGTVASFDMLGEGARTAEDAQRHFGSYLHAIRTTSAMSTDNVDAGHGVSVKLSALHPRYEYASKERVVQELLPRIVTLAREAKAGGIQLTIDAEEAARLELSLDLIEHLAREPSLAGWQGLGLALQCYSKRALTVLDWLIALARERQRRFRVRLVKGAYWDTEIKRAQELGTPDYPVFTRKVTTDLSYLACAQKALAHPEQIYPQFATHNAHTIASVMNLAGRSRDFEFQRLHGMGKLLYSAAKEVVADLPRVRVYAPVGAHKDLLAYLVRRLLENGANTSFVNRFMDERTSLDQLIEDPVTQMSPNSVRNPHIPLPANILGARANSLGFDLNATRETEELLAALGAIKSERWTAVPIVSGKRSALADSPVRNPARRSDILGHSRDANRDECLRAIADAVAGQKAWDRAGAEMRATALERAADAFEGARTAFVSLLIREAGKTLPDAIAEIRETVDFCRYYAAQARAHFLKPLQLPGPTGEQNLYSLHGRGAFVCISPWNFPLAIFVGQVTAALAAGNTVLAKPAEQTPLIAAAAVKLLHDAGVPVEALHFLPGTGEVVGATLVADERIAGVVMTGSTATAKIIARTLANRAGPIIPLIAETGGQNAMFVDSTALPEQVVDDVVRSAFHSAGQRCSALRVLYLQEDVADGMIEMIKGAMNELKVGDPAQLSTDVGPVIDEEARSNLISHVSELAAAGRLLHASPTTEACSQGAFVAPHLFEIPSIEALDREHFGPLLHVVRYRAEDLDDHLAQVNATGYGLTLGVQSRIEAVVHKVFDSTSAGNTYVNRNMIGAVVGVQPFGGHGLSGTGPKAGGPLYLQRFATERVLTINTAASGGNVELLRMESIPRQAL